MMDVVKAQTYMAPVAGCFETLCKLLPDMGITINARDVQSWTVSGEYQNRMANGEADGPVVAFKAVCTPIYNTTTMVKLSSRNPGQPEIAAPAIEAKLVAMLDALGKRLTGAPDPPASNAYLAKAWSAPASQTEATLSIDPGQDPFDYARAAVQAGVPRAEIQRNLMEQGYDDLGANRFILSATLEREDRKLAVLREAADYTRSAVYMGVPRRRNSEQPDSARL